MVPARGRVDAMSQVHATILLVGITIILAMMVLLLFHLPSFDTGTSPPPIFIISNIIHTDDETGALDYDSRLVILHNGTRNFRNDNLSAWVYRNGGEWSCHIETLNGAKFIPTHHFKIETLGGSGCSGDLFTPGEQLVVNLKDGVFHPGDIARFDVVDTLSGKVISTHSVKVK